MMSWERENMKKTHDYEYQYENEGVVGSCHIRIFEGEDRPIIIATQQREPPVAHRGSVSKSANIIAAHFIEDGPLPSLQFSHELREESVHRKTLDLIANAAPFVFVEEYLEPEHKVSFLWFDHYEPVWLFADGKEQVQIGYPYRQPTSSEEVETLIGRYSFVCQCDERFRSACEGLPFYGEHEDKPLCVLHYPGFDEKVTAFDAVVDEKIRKGDLNFRGTWFPDARSFEVSEDFAGLADFSYATFNQAPGEDIELFTLFTDNRFSQDVSFHKTTFCTEALFSGVSFAGNVDFSEATFEGPATFDEEVRFRKLTDFSGTRFADEADFSGARFEGGVRFSKTEFAEDANFYDTVFYADDKTSSIDFTQVMFRHEVHFGNARFYADTIRFSEGPYTENARVEFLGEVDFGEASFGGEARDGNFRGDTHFSNIEFPEEADFATATFHGKAIFDSVIFNEESKATFYDTKFLGPAYFAKTKFPAETNFIDAQFAEGSDASFDETEFRGFVMFDSAIFDKAFFRGAAFKDATFRNASFGSADFFKSTFAETIDFQGCAWKQANFSEAKFYGDANFLKTTFQNEATFSEAIMIGRTTFSGTDANRMFRPETNVSFQYARVDEPNQLTFHTVLLRPGWFVNMDARNLNFINVKWHGLPSDSKEPLQNEISALKARNVESPYGLLAKTCRELYTNYEENREYPIANEFHYWSMDALRMDDWKRFGLIRTLYWAMSGYGERPGRAFGVLVFIWVAFTTLYFVLGPETLSITSNPAESIGHLWQAAVYSLSALARLRPNPVPEFGLFQLLVTLEGLLGPLQIALFALAVRRKVMR